MIDLRLSCPSCRRALAKARAGLYATQHVTRRCGSCRIQWWVKLEPIAARLPGIRAIHEVTYLDLARVPT